VLYFCFSFVCLHHISRSKYNLKNTLLLWCRYQTWKVSGQVYVIMCVSGIEFFLCFHDFFIGFWRNFFDNVVFSIFSTLLTHLDIV
jgi:hypothetical protein